MGRPASDTTLLRQARSELRVWKKRWEETMRERNQYLSRVNRAEAEALEWKRRFDILLARQPETQEVKHGE